MNNLSTSMGVAEKEPVVPMATQIQKRFEDNVARLWKNINIIEDRCHALVNLRTPIKNEEANNPLENDFSQKMNNGLASLSMANDKLAQIVEHLNQIV